MAAAAVAVGLAVAVATPGVANADGSGAPGRSTAPGGPNACPPGAVAVGFSDALNKLVVNGETVGGLSALAYDPRRHAYAAVVDRTGTLPARLWFFTNPASPKVVGTLVLKNAAGVAYDGTNFDGEGLVVLPDGQYAVSSETEPSIRIFDRTGTEVASLPVPARFQVAPAGEAINNATLEGLTISPSERFIYAAMEGALSGDAPVTGEVALRRVLVYERLGHDYKLIKQLGYQVEAGNRISEIAAYRDGSFVVMEASFTAGVGNGVSLYAVPDARRGGDVSAIPNLSAAPARVLVGKRLVADLTKCPTLGATSPEPQINPLLDNYEALALDPAGIGRGTESAYVLSDDNFSATQVTRLLRLEVRLP
ncbi:esterase-like activity of phytase family protein [Pseudofrankia sp. BMG5.37]|uniref:esterase-like activity of phytase family protein n=1 Tax=Pseudofrankia sp. BMG5.37 TaxID=3050035 RepID=UPI002895DD3D|nr:esterase-like activity of phytase family protein [Pseudofrankia sp. BMG5.37]MDT3443384.1 esterase-like activity of phytase family protein [Pseudofrankia sp. BMG5.37]